MVSAQPEHVRMSAHHCRLKDLRFQIKCADGNVPEAFRGNWFEASIGPSVETRIKRVVCAHWMSTVDSDIGEKAGKRWSVCLKSGDDPLRALTEAPQPGHSLVLLTWRCHTMGPQSGILKGQLCSVSFLRGTRALPYRDSSQGRLHRRPPRFYSLIGSSAAIAHEAPRHPTSPGTNTWALRHRRALALPPHQPRGRI